MNFTINFVLLLVAALFINSNKTIAYQQPGIHTQDLQEHINFIGEIKGKSYIKVILNPMQLSSAYQTADSELLKYKGTYYESVSGRTYTITGNFNSESNTWTFRCFNKNNQPVFVFSGKQKPDGTIEGFWRSKNYSYPFYLRPA